MEKSGTLLGASLLITGTAIGAGMLALPVSTSLGGFLPSIVILFLCWLFTACTALLLLEVCLWMKQEANLVSMAEYTLGKGGKIVAWTLFLFMFYGLTTAYVSGGGNLLVAIMEDAFVLPDWSAAFLFLGIFAPFVYIGARAVDRINSLFVLGLIISFFLFIWLGYGYVNNENLRQIDWKASLLALPVLFVAFGFHGIIPTIAMYLQYNYKKIRRAILIGSAMPLIAYVIWEWLILGIVPVEGEGGLAEALMKNQSAIFSLKNAINVHSVYIIGTFFAFFALVTSFLGVSLAMLDFLADGLSIKKNRKGRALLCAMIFFPPLLISLINPNVFIDAVRYAGGFGMAFLFGVLPVLMVWSGRYRMKLQGLQALSGGRFSLLLLLIFVLFEVGSECLRLYTHSN